MIQRLDAAIPDGPLETKWSRYKASAATVPISKRSAFEVVVVGTGLAGASAAATLGELGYTVRVFCISDSPRRAHSVAAQGGINAAKNYKNDGDSVDRLFEETLKGGDYRAREANVYRLAQISNQIIDQCVAQGVPFARDYDGKLANRSFGGTHVSRTFYARGQTGQQLLLGAYAALNRQVAKGTVHVYERREMMDLVVDKGRACGIIVRNLVTGVLERYAAHAVVLATGGYGNVFFLSTNAMNSNGSALMQCYRKGALFANPCFTQIHPTCIPVHGEHQAKLTLMSESLRNDGRIWVPLNASDISHTASSIPDERRDFYLERRYPSYGNLVPRDIASRAAKERCDAGFGVGTSGRAVYLDFRDAFSRLGKNVMDEKYGNLFKMYEKITGTSPYCEPMMIYPAVHYTMGGLWVDYQLMTTIPGLFAIGEANFSDHGANRLGASALMQGLADGYFILPITVSDYLARNYPFSSYLSSAFTQAEMDVQRRIRAILTASRAETDSTACCKVPTDDFYKELGKIMWEYVGMERSREGLIRALAEVEKLKQKFEVYVCVPGSQYSMNQELEKALRVWDYFDLAQLMIHDALLRKESCGGHFRKEFQTEEGEALRDDSHYQYVSAWEFNEAEMPIQHIEPLVFERVKPVLRSYK